MLALTLAIVLAPGLLPPASLTDDRFLLVAENGFTGRLEVGPLRRVDPGPDVERFCLLVEQGYREVEQPIVPGPVILDGLVIQEVYPSESRLVLRDLTCELSDRAFDTPGLNGYSWSATTGKIAYGGMRAEQYLLGGGDVVTYCEVHVLDVETKVDRVIGLGCDPLYSPDGEFIAFVEVSAYTHRSCAVRRSQMGVMRQDGSQRRLLGSGRPLLWSPSSSLLLYWLAGEQYPGTGAVRCLDLASGSDVPVVEGIEQYPERIQFTDDGSRIAFSRQSETTGLSLSQLDLRTGEERPLFADPRPDRSVGRLLWSPDSRWIAFNVISHGMMRFHAALLLIDVEQAGVRTVVKPGDCGPWFCWQER